MALQTKVYTTTKNTFTLELTLVENSTSTSGNSSSVSYTLKLKSTSKDFYLYRVGAKVVLDGNTVAVRDRPTAPQLSLGTNSSLTLLSGTTTVGHASDGSKSMAVSYSLDMAEASYTPGAMNGSGAMVMTKIPRGATITSAPDFTDEDNPKITVSNPAGVTVEASIYMPDGYTELAAYRKITVPTYTFQLTNAEREAIRQANTTANSFQVRFYVRSTVGGQLFRNYAAKTVTIKNPSPTLSPTVEDVNPATVALTGDKTVIVRSASHAQVAFGATAVKFATIAGKSVVCGSRSITNDGIIIGAESGTFAFTVKDSRGNTTKKTVERELVPYVRPTCNLGEGLPTPTGEFDFEVSGDAFIGSFGQSDNELTVEARHKEHDAETWGLWQPMAVTLLSDRYTATLHLTGLDYKKVQDFQARVADRLTVVESGILSIQAEPLWFYGPDGFYHNTPVYLADEVDGKKQYRTMSTCGMTAYRSGNMTGVRNEVIPLNAIHGQYGPGIKLQSNGIYIPCSGFYMVSGQMMVADGASGYYIGIQINRNGAGLLDAYCGYSKGYGTVAISPSVVSLDEGDIITLNAIGSNAPSGIQVAGNTRTKLTVTQVF